MKLSKILTELVDIYSPDELESKGIEYEIVRETAKRFYVQLNYKDQHYILSIANVWNPATPTVAFGSTDENYEHLQMRELLNSKYSARILAAITGLLRYWVDKHNIQQFEYSAEGRVRNSLYMYYLKKHFSDFKPHKESHMGESVIVWKRI